MIWFVAGINGAGKSTASSNSALLDFMGVNAVVNPDTLARTIAEEQKID